MIGEIAVSAANFTIDKPYSYLAPEGAQLKPGMRVIVPFGRGNRPSEGVVLSVKPGNDESLKTVTQILDDEPLISEAMLRLAAFVRSRCYCSFYDAVRAMLPAGLWFQSKDSYALTQDRSWEGAALRQKTARTLLQILSDCGGETSGDILRDGAGDEEAFQKAIAYLQKKKWVVSRQSYRRKASDKTEKMVSLSASVEEAMEYAARCPRSASAQRSVLELMCRVGSAALKEVCYFTGAKAPTVKRLSQLGYLTLTDRKVLRCRQIEPAQVEKPLKLNVQQEKACLGLSAQMEQEDPGAALLHGVTGSGKTAVYIALIQKCLERNRQAVLLVPEIALTPQLLGVMAAWFGQQVAVLHSSLSTAERYDQWNRVRRGDARVVVGTRSAVFAPCTQLGLIILDEEQEHSYKSDNTPRYTAKEVALWRGLKEKALVLFGSATPSVETMYAAKTGVYSLYTLSDRYGGRKLPKVQIVDMKQQLKLGNDTALSYPLQDAIGEAAQAGKQTVLFLNRRGNSRALVCVECGQAPECPRCSARLTYHSANERLMCHYCGYSQPAAVRCQCGGQLKPVGTGTQKIQQQLENIFPGMEVARMDADTVSIANPHEKILEHFQKENVPVLLGTQMVAKGLNLPNVTLVGVLDGDLGLYTDSFRAHETTFNMLTQVVGRAGRGDTDGQAIIQTLVPEHQVITLAAAQDYAGFYESELSLRQAMNAPPFADIVEITFTGPEEARVLHGAAKFRDSLKVILQDKQYGPGEKLVLGPAPCPVPKINYNYRYRITLRCGLNPPIRNLLGHLLRQFGKDKDNRNVTAFIDINGFD